MSYKPVPLFHPFLRKRIWFWRAFSEGPCLQSSFLFCGEAQCDKTWWPRWQKPSKIFAKMELHKENYIYFDQSWSYRSTHCISMWYVLAGSLSDFYWVFGFPINPNPVCWALYHLKIFHFGKIYMEMFVPIDYWPIRMWFSGKESGSESWVNPERTFWSILFINCQFLDCKWFH